MFPLTPTMGVAAGAGVLIVALGAGVKVQSSRLEACKAQYAEFKVKVEVLGREAEEQARKIEAEDKTRKEKADALQAKTKRERDSLYTAYRSLRDQRTSESSLPPASTGSANPERACLQRSTFDSGMADIDRQLFDGAEALIRKGDDSRIGLDAAKIWAQHK